jgi:hypothetical protein
VATIAELAEDRTVEGVYAVTRKERRRTRAGAPYLALELADASGRIEARVWSDVELLDQRFDEGDAVRVLGRVERFGGKLQVQVRAVEAAEDADPSELTPSLRRDADELDGFLEFLAAEITHPGLAALVGSFVRDADVRSALRALPAAGARDAVELGGVRARSGAREGGVKLALVAAKRDAGHGLAGPTGPCFRSFALCSRAVPAVLASTRISLAVRSAAVMPSIPSGGRSWTTIIGGLPCAAASAGRPASRQ